MTYWCLENLSKKEGTDPRLILIKRHLEILNQRISGLRRKKIKDFEMWMHMINTLNIKIKFNPYEPKNRKKITILSLKLSN